MELHAAYFLKCGQAAKWLNTPETPAGVAKEFLDGARAVSVDADPPAPLSVPKKNVQLHRLYVPVELWEHFIFGVALGPVVPSPRGTDPEQWQPFVNRFVLDAGRKCCLMFSYFPDGSIVVSIDCFDEIGDHVLELTYFQPTPIVGVFPRGIRARMHILEKRDCPSCADANSPCSCSDSARLDALISARQQRQGNSRQPGTGPAHAGVLYRSENVTISTYPYWAQNLDQFVNSRIGSYSVMVQSSATITDCATLHTPPRRADPFAVRYRASFSLEPRSVVEQLLRTTLFDKGLTPLKPPATDVRWETSSTTTVNARNIVKTPDEAPATIYEFEWHKLPGLQEDYLLVAPSNIVSSARARAEYESAEAQRRAIASSSMAHNPGVELPLVPQWASGSAAVFTHALTAAAAVDDAALSRNLLSFTFRNDGDDDLGRRTDQGSHGVHCGEVHAAGPGDGSRPSASKRGDNVGVWKARAGPWTLPSREPWRASMPSVMPRMSRKRMRSKLSEPSLPSEGIGDVHGDEKGVASPEREFAQSDGGERREIQRGCRNAANCVDSITGYVRYDAAYDATIESNRRSVQARKRAKIVDPKLFQPP